MQIHNEQATKLTFNIGIVISRFNETITQKMFDSAVEHLNALGFTENQVTIAWVPGAVEIPIVLQRMADTENYDALIALGAVIRGETSHYDTVCQMTSEGCQCVSLDNDIPVVFGVLTVDNKEQALARLGGAKGNKAKDAVDTACEMVALLKQLD